MHSIDIFAQAIFKCQNFVPESEFDEYVKTCISRPIDSSGYRDPLVISEDELEGYEEEHDENPKNDVNVILDTRDLTVAINSEQIEKLSGSQINLNNENDEVQK